MVVLVLIFACLFPYSNQIYGLISMPLQSYLPKGTSMIATEVAAPFLAPFKLSAVAALFLAMPFVLHQLWAFISPGLYRSEKKVAIPLLVGSICLFYLGVAFAYFLVFPLIFSFFTQAGPENVKVMTDISHYLDFVLTLFFAFGFAFEIPIILVLFVASKLSSVNKLAKKRPYIIVSCFFFGMILTPPDVISQSLLALPMWFLFEMGLLLARLVPTT